MSQPPYGPLHPDPHQPPAGPPGAAGQPAHDPWRSEPPTAGFPPPGGAQTGGGPQYAYPQVHGYGPGYGPGPGYGGEVLGTNVVGTDVLDSTRRRRRAPIIISVAAVVALLLGGTAVAGAWVWFGWGTTQPEDVLPGSSMAFARIDMSPGLGQKMKLDNLAKKFPKATKSTQDFVDQLKEDMFEALDLEPLTYEADVKPWFADRVGIAAWAKDGNSGTPCVLFALASKDDGKARAAFTKVQDRLGADEFGFAFNDGYVILAGCSEADSQGSADAAVAAAKSESLAANDTFASALGELPGGQTVVFWADLSRAADFAGSIDPAARDALESGGADLKGQIIVGAQATDNGVDLRYRLTGQGEATATRDVLTELAALPGNTTVGAAADLSSVRDNVASLDGLITRLEEEAHAGSIRSGVQAILGSVLSVAITDMASEEPVLRIVAQATSAGDAAAIEAMLDELSNEPNGLPPGASIQRSGDRISLSAGNYREAEGKLSDKAIYREAMDGVDGTSVMAVFVDVERMVSQMELSSDARDNVRPIKAVGFTNGYDGDTLVGLLRVVIK